MAKNDGPELDEIDDNDPQAPSQLRAYAARQGEQAVKARGLERELAAVKAGIDLDTRKGQAWLAGFTGDITDREGMLADAKDFDPSIVKVAAPVANADGTELEGGTSTEPAAPVETPTGSAQRSALTDGGLPSGAAIEDVRTASLEAGRELLEKGGTQSEAMGELVARRAQGLLTGKLEPLPSSGRQA